MLEGTSSPKEDEMKAVARSRPCPRCGRRSLQAVSAAGQINQFCTTCHRCWTQEFGYLIEVNRYACSGCDDRTRCRPI
jgi:hypothetical protein